MKKWIVGKGRGQGGGGWRKVFGGLPNRVPNNFSRLDTAGYEFGSGDAAFCPVFGPLLSRFPPRHPMPLKRVKTGLDCVKTGWGIRG